MRRPEPVVLAGHGVVLEPLSPAHAGDLLAAAQDSRAAIARLGGHHDGTLRHDRLRPDGSVRDSACFSVLAVEWPQVRAGLRARLVQAAPERSSR